jgi:hypothetical protein
MFLPAYALALMTSLGTEISSFGNFFQAFFSIITRNFCIKSERIDPFNYMKFTQNELIKSAVADFYMNLTIWIKLTAGVLLVAYLTYIYRKAAKYEQGMAPTTKSTLFFKQLLDTIEESINAPIQRIE